MSLIAQQPSPGFVTRGQVPKQGKGSRAPGCTHFSIFSNNLLSPCPRQVARWSPDTGRGETDSSATGQRGKSLWPFLHPRQEPIPVGTPLTALTVPQRIAGTRPFRILTSPSPGYSSQSAGQENVLWSPLPSGHCQGSDRYLLKSRSLPELLAAKESGKSSLLLQSLHVGRIPEGGDTDVEHPQIQAREGIFGV